MKRADRDTSALERRGPWALRAFRAQAAISWVTGASTVVLGLAVCWVASYAVGGAGKVPPHWFYIPIMFAAARFGPVGAAATAVAGGLIAGPLLPLDVAQSTHQSLSDWGGRTIFFLFNGLVMSFVITGLRTALAHELEIAHAKRDLAFKEEAARALREARDEAERANHAKSEFLSRMSHELRTPLNAILGFAQLLGMDELEPEQRDNLDQIHRAGEHLLALINEVLDIARIEEGRLTLSVEPVSVGEVLDEAVELVGPLSRNHGIQITTQPRERDWHVMADRQRLKQVFLNLLANAVKYNRAGGTVTILCEKVAEERVRISVNDTGPGVAPEHMERLFTPFDRLGADATGIEGTGIGLALSKRLVELMGGLLLSGTG